MESSIKELSKYRFETCKEDLYDAKLKNRLTEQLSLLNILKHI